MLDYGCGVGRLVVPFSKIGAHVVGMDVSESMLEEAKINCDSNGLDNVVLLKADDNLSALDHKFDLINSYIVFQHIPVSRGLTILKNMIS